MSTFVLTNEYECTVASVCVSHECLVCSVPETHRHATHIKPYSVHYVSEGLYIG